MLIPPLTQLAPDPATYDDITRRGLLGGLGAVAATSVLASCGADDAPVDPAGPGSRDFVDSAGRTVRVPARPARIVSLHEPSSGEALLSIGAPVVGMTNYGSGFLETLTRHYDLSAVTEVGNVDEPDLEAVAALRPDLVVALFSQDGATAGNLDLAELERLAPTVFLDNRLTQDEYLALLGDLTGLGEEVERQRTEYHAARDAARARLAPVADDLSFVQVSPFGGTVYASSATAPYPVVQVALELGARLPAAAVEASDRGEIYLELSEEELPSVDADVVFWFLSGEDPRDLALWPRLRAVRAGQAYAVAPDDERTGKSYITSLATLAVVEPLLAGARTDVVDEPAG